MTPILEEMGDFFDRRAQAYDERHTQGIDGGLESKRVPASFLPGHARTLIDLGIGTGLELEAIFERFPDMEVTGLDIAENMLRLLRGKYPGKNIRLHRASYLDYEFGAGAYDAALSVMTLHHYDHGTKTRLYRRIHRCLKQGGVYIECDYMLSEHETENPQAMEDHYFAQYACLRAEQGIPDGGEYHYDTPCTVDNQRRMMRNAGFGSVEEVWRKGNTVVLVAR